MDEQGRQQERACPVLPTPTGELLADVLERKVGVRF